MVIWHPFPPCLCFSAVYKCHIRLGPTRPTRSSGIEQPRKSSMIPVDPPPPTPSLTCSIHMSRLINFLLCLLPLLDKRSCDGRYLRRAPTEIAQAETGKLMDVLNDLLQGRALPGPAEHFSCSSIGLLAAITEIDSQHRRDQDAYRQHLQELGHQLVLL